MKVIHVGYSFLPISGGEELYIKELSRLIEKQGWEQVIIQRGFREVFRDGSAKPYGKAKVVPVGLLAPRNANGPVLDRQLFYNFLIFGKLFSSARKGDVIIVHYPQLFFPSAWLVKKLRGARTICLSHGITWDNPEKTFKEKLLYAWVKLLNMLALALSDLLVANDTIYAREAERLCNGSKKKIRVIFNFVDVDEFRPGRRITKDRIILCPRNLRYARGVDIAIQAMEKVNKKHRNAKLLILGEGPIRAELDEMIKRLGVNAEIRGFAGKTEMLSHYNSCEIVAIPSRYSEGTSLAGLEAMACGKPIITTNIGGLPDITKNGKNGIMINPSAEELAEAIIKLLDNPKLASKMGKEGRRMAENEFSHKRWEKSWKKAIGEMV